MTIPDNFETKKELFNFLIENKDDIIADKCEKKQYGAGINRIISKSSVKDIANKSESNDIEKDVLQIEWL